MQSINKNSRNLETRISGWNFVKGGAVLALACLIKESNNN